MNIFWFRRDLRLDDNVGLYHALNSDDEVLPVFIFDTTILSQLHKYDPRVTFIHQQLTLIEEQLKAIGKSLAVFHGNPFEVFIKLIAENKINCTKGLLLMEYDSDAEAAELRKRYCQ